MQVLYQIMQRHHFIPEAVTADFQIHWGQHLLRPEFVESTYFLYKATQDPHYLEVGLDSSKSRCLFKIHLDYLTIIWLCRWAKVFWKHFRNTHG